MYSTCTFCYGDLGTNEIVEAYAVGSKLAFDSAKGRLWVICSRCARWNLSPLEERWEAIEAAERAFSRATVRASTDNISLARARDGTVLIRVGTPHEPELAAWRYGATFRARYRKAMLLGGALVCVTAAGIVAGFTAAAAVPGASILVNVPNWAHSAYVRRRIVGRVNQIDGTVSYIRARDVGEARLISRGPGDWFLSVKHDNGSHTYDGMEAIRASAPLLAWVNLEGARQKTVSGALQLLRPGESATDAVDRLALASRRHPVHGYPQQQSFYHYSRESRLALKMIASDDVERRAADGEVRYLERAWREAEEIALIADGVLTSSGIAARLTMLKARVAVRSTAGD